MERTEIEQTFIHREKNCAKKNECTHAYKEIEPNQAVAKREKIDEMGKNKVLASAKKIGRYSL